MEDVLNRAVLVLNSGMIPISVCTVRKAILDIFREIALPVRESDRYLHSPSMKMAVPLVVSHHRYHKIPRREKRISKINVVYRDNHTCAYCRRKFTIRELTLDHIIPRSRWKKIMGEHSQYGFNSWQNLVAACNKCNSVKSNRLIHELGWKLDFSPAEPDHLPALAISRKRAESMGWLDYCHFNVRLV